MDSFLIAHFVELIITVLIRLIEVKLSILLLIISQSDQPKTTLI